MFDNLLFWGILLMGFVFIIGAKFKWKFPAVSLQKFNIKNGDAERKGIGISTNQAMGVGAVILMVIVLLLFFSFKAALVAILGIFLIYKGGSLGKWVGISLMILVLFAGPHFQKMTGVWYEHTGAVIEGKKPLIPVTVSRPVVTPIVTEVSVTVPPGGTIPVPFVHGCIVNSEGDLYSKYITRVTTGTGVVFTSSSTSEEVMIRVVHYKLPGKGCTKETVELLMAQGHIK